MPNKTDATISLPLNEEFLHSLTDQGGKFNEKIFEILSLIWQSGGLHQKAIADRLKLSKGAICRYSDALIKEDIVTKENKANHLNGRNPVLLQFKKDLFYSIGISLTGANKTKVIILDATNKTVDERISSQEVYSEETCIALVENVRSIIKKNKVPKEKIIGIGITLPGIILPDHGLIVSSSRFSIKGNFNLRAYLKKKLKLCVEMINTSHIEPLMERKWGDAGDLRSFLTISRHFSLGMYLNGQLYRGHQQMAGETGFFQFDNIGRLGLDGRKGIYNVVTPIYEITNKISDLIAAGKHTIAKEYLNEKGSYCQIWCMSHYLKRPLLLQFRP